MLEAENESLPKRGGSAVVKWNSLFRIAGRSAGIARIVGRGPTALFVLLVVLLGGGCGRTAALVARCAALPRSSSLSAAAGLVAAAGLREAHRTHQRKCKYHRQ